MKNKKKLQSLPLLFLLLYFLCGIIRINLKSKEPRRRQGNMKHLQVVISFLFLFGARKPHNAHFVLHSTLKECETKMFSQVTMPSCPI